MTDTPQQIALLRPSLESEQEGTVCHPLFTALVERQSRFVFRVAYAVLRNAHDSEDVVQETFLKIYRARRWERMDNERAFLARTAWRIAVGRVKVQKRAGELDLDSSPECSAANPEQAVLTTEWNAVVHRLIDALPEDLRQPLALSSIDRLNSHEISEVMGIPEGTVRTRLMRARQMLKQKLGTLMEGRHGKQ